MSQVIQIAKELALPIDVATEACAFIARRGGGKTYAASLLAELLIRAGVQVLVLDLVGKWWGLRLAADGKTASGLDVAILGGLRGDIPLEATGGRLVAETAVSTGSSMIFDLSQFSIRDRRRFAAEFAEALWSAKKRQDPPVPVMLFVEESQIIVPQKVGRDEAVMVGRYEELIRLGRNFGIGTTLISQRPQSVNKEVLSQVECLFVGQTNGAHERKALLEWISDKGMDRKLVDELPSLRPGQMWLWSPGWLRVLERLQIATKSTFDASATPKVGDRHKAAAVLAPLDLAKLRAAMAETVERARRDDPRELQREIVKLRSQIAKLEQVADMEARAAVAEEVRQAKADAAVHSKFMRSVETSINGMEAALNVLKIAIAAAAETQVTTPTESVRRVENRTHVSLPPSPARQRPTRSQAISADAGSELGKGERAVLSAIAMYPGGADRDQLSVLTGYKRSSRDTYIQRLTSGGYADASNGRVVATEAGIAALGSEYEPLPTGEDLARYWLDRLPEGERSVLKVLLEHNGEEVERGTIDERTGYRRSSRDTYLQRLGSRRLVERGHGGRVRAAAALFDGER